MSKMYDWLGFIVVSCVSATLLLWMFSQLDNFLPPKMQLNSIGTVILYDGRGEMESSKVETLGGVCWVEWFKGIEKVVLLRDGTAHDGNFHYIWTLNQAGPADADADLAWYDKNCKEPDYSTRERQ